MKRIFITLLLLSIIRPALEGRIFEMSAFGIKPGATNLSEKISSAMESIRKETGHGDSVTLRFLPGRYDFHSTDALQRTYYISNHDQSEQQAVGIAIEGWENLTLDGRGAELVFHGVIIPFAVTDSKGCSVKNLSIDFENPQTAQVRIVENRGAGGIVFRPESWVKHRISRDSVFLYGNTDTRLTNINVHYAFGMGLIAQFCDGITLNGFSVCLKNENDPRYFTTQADATHFSQCSGIIQSSGGLYEGMMDDAINVHGIYLKVTGIKGDRSITARFMHDQAWGFRWGCPGDSVRMLNADVMEYTGSLLHIESVTPDNTGHGSKELTITFREPIELDPERMNIGIENLSRTPEVIFSGNTVRNNRARGALFSSPRRTVVENNVFDHTSGSAILLCGDCNGWYESGACRDILIKDNRFINALTSMYQFTTAVISIYPEIPDLHNQTVYFHGGHPGAITITGNTFETFDMPVLYAKSVDGLVFKDNTVIVNNDYRPFHKNRNRFLLERTDNIEISY